MEVVFYEDPACGWCWAFQPTRTAFLFEYGESVSWRILMGGLRNSPVCDIRLVKRHWRTARESSGMPFDERVWDEHVLSSTWVACRAIKAAGLRDRGHALALLRRVQEAFCVERARVDDLAVILELAQDCGIDKGQILDHLASGRAQALFELDRREAAEIGFDFPTTVVRRHRVEEPRVLMGAVPYENLVEALVEEGVPGSARQRFADTPRDWNRLFSIHARLCDAEISLVTRLEGEALEARLRAIGASRSDRFWVRDASAVEAPAKALVSSSAMGAR